MTKESLGQLRRLVVMGRATTARSRSIRSARTNSEVGELCDDPHVVSGGICSQLQNWTYQTYVRLRSSEGCGRFDPIGLEEATYQRSLSAQNPFLRNPLWGELLVNACMHCPCGTLPVTPHGV